jgi:ribokinase
VPEPPRLAVIGHVEWVTHTDAPFIPAAGEIVHLKHPVEQPAGGGAVTAAALARFGADVSFYTAVGDDLPVAARLEELGVRVLAAERNRPHTRALVMRDPQHERTIAVVGENLHPEIGDPLPWEELAGMDGVFFTGWDPATLRAAREAPLLIVTARRFTPLVESGVRADVLLGSGRDPGERVDLDRLSVQPDRVVETFGKAGGTDFQAVEPPGPVVDSYGAGDTFAAGLLFGMATGLEWHEALAYAARAAAEAVTWRGAYPQPDRQPGW